MKPSLPVGADCPAESAPGVSRAFLRLCGLLYLGIIALGLFGEMAVRGSLVVGSDPARTLSNIAASPGLWRAGIAGDLLMHLFDLPVTLGLYLLFRPVDRLLAQLSTLMCLVQTSVLVLNKLALFFPLLLADPASAGSGLDTATRASLTLLAARLHGYGFALGLAFFGVACVLRGVLALRSGFLPPGLGVLLVLAGVGYVVNTFSLILAPDLAARLFPWILLPAFVGELAMAIWLLWKGGPPSPP